MKREKTIIIFGSSGMAGHIIYDVLKAKYSEFNVIGITRTKVGGYTDEICDISNQLDVTQLLKRYNPSLVINCIGALIKNSELKKAESLFVNGYFPIFLSEIACDLGFNLIHLSTDCVFDGLKGGYSVKELPNAKNWYGFTKSIGENVIHDRTCVIRTSIIGPEIRKKELREGLFDWFYNQKNKVKGYDQVYWSGITTLELSRFICEIIEKLPLGIFHLTNGDRISKYQLLNELNKIRIIPIIINKDSDLNSDKSLLISENLNFEVHPYSRQLNDLKTYLIKNKARYDYNF
jgi:dTDP-4-dehydrorhamnose reductase